MDSSLEKKLLEKSKEIGEDLSSKAFSLAMDAQDSVHHLRGHFHYPKMKDLPHGNYWDEFVLVSVLTFVSYAITFIQIYILLGTPSQRFY